MSESFQITVLIALTAFAGITAQVMGAYLKIPSIVFLLLLGIALGPDGLALVNPELLGRGLESLVSLLVALILFEGGLNLQVRELSKTSGSLRNLVTIGTAITLVVGATAAHLIAGFSWQAAFLFASLVTVTGPTVIGPLLKQVAVDRRITTILEGEGVLIDPVGAIVAVIVLSLVLSSDFELNQILVELITRLSIGVALGGTGGWLLGWFINRATILSADLKNLIVLSSVWILFSLAQYVEGESGLMAVVVAGVVLNTSSIEGIRLLKRFQGQLTILSVSVLFILLAADLSLESLFALGWGGVFTVLSLMFIVRPLNIWVCTWGSDLSWQQKLFISWIGPKGIVSASVASLFAILLGNVGIDGEAVKALVFLTIIFTVIIQGLTAQWIANALGVTADQVSGAVIVGSNPLARLIARLLKEREQHAILIDTNPEAIKAAEKENLPAIWSSAMKTETLEEAGLDSIGTFLAITTNSEVNSVLAERAVEEFDPPRVLALFPQAKPSAQPSKIRQALINDLPLKDWNDSLNNQDVKLFETHLTEPGFEYQQTYLQALIDTGKLLPLIFERQKQFYIVRAGQSWGPDDRIICLIKSPKSRLMRQLSGSDPVRLTLEQLPDISEIPLSASETAPAPPAETTLSNPSLDTATHK